LPAELLTAALPSCDVHKSKLTELWPFVIPVKVNRFEFMLNLYCTGIVYLNASTTRRLARN
jgi:hypothetical protein